MYIIKGVIKEKPRACPLITPLRAFKNHFDKLKKEGPTCLGMGLIRIPNFITI
jgi:hypothetical protein